MNYPVLAHAATRWSFSSRYALRHLFVSVAVGITSTAYVFGLLYPPPYQAMLDVANIFLILLFVDVVCGPLLTLVLASPEKSHRAHAVDFTLIGTVQMLALLYGLHSMWVARPVILAFETDRLVVATANEIQTANLPQALPDMQRLPWWGITPVNTRQPKDGAESLQAIDLGLSGVSPAMLPDWWLPWETAQADMAARAKPVTELQQRRSKDAAVLDAAIAATGHPAAALRYLPLTSSKTREWVALLDAQMRIVGYAPVDGF